VPTLEELRQEADSRSLVRKIQIALGMLAPITAELPESIYGANGSIMDFKAAGYKPVGLVTPDGYSFTREISTSDVNALGYTSAIRTDTDTVVRGINFTALESGKRHLLELKYGVALTGVEQDPVTGEIVWDEPDLPINEEYRFVVLGADGPALENWIQGRGFGRVKLTSSGDETWGQEGAVQHEFGLNVFTDDELGSPGRHYLGGTGALKHKALLGFGATATP
jgi:hypothetical protein